MKKILFAATLLFSFSVFATEVPPRPEGFVSDTTNVLTPEQFKTLDAKLRAFHDKAGGNMVVVILDSLKGEDIETAGINIAREWKVGKKGESNGILFIVAIKDHKDRVEVGEGLEGKITDGRAGEIADTARPFFRKKDWAGGIDNVASLIISDITGFPPPAATVPAATPRTPISGWTWLIIIVVVLLIIIFLASCKSGNGDSLLYVIASSVSDSSSSSSWSSSDSSSSSSNSSSDSSSDSGGSFGGGGGSSDW